MKDLTTTLAFRSVLFFLLAIVTGCTTYTHYVKPEDFSAHIADYSVKPDHKAIYWFLGYNDPHTGISDVASGYPSVEQAEAAAKEACQAALAAQGVSGECHPYAVDNQLTGWDVTPYLHDPWCDSNPCSNQPNQSGLLENLQSLLAAGNAVQAARQNQTAAYEHYMQDLTAVQQRKQMEANQQAGNAQTAALEQQIATLKAELQQKQTGPSQSTQPPPVSESLTTPGPGSGSAPVTKSAPDTSTTSSPQCDSVLAANFSQFCRLPQPGSSCASAQAEEICFGHAVKDMQGVCPQALTDEYTQQLLAAKATADQVCPGPSAPAG